MLRQEPRRLLDDPVAAVASCASLGVRSAWSDWITFFSASSVRGTLLIPRVIAAALIVVAGALTNRPWTLAVAVWIALPVVWVESWVILLATIRLTRLQFPAVQAMSRAALAEAG